LRELKFWGSLLIRIPRWGQLVKADWTAH